MNALGGCSAGTDDERREYRRIDTGLAGASRTTCGDSNLGSDHIF